MVTVRFPGADGIPAEVAASAGIGEHETEIVKIFDGKVITGFEEMESVMALLYEHQIWPGQLVEITSSEHERMVYRYLIVIAEDLKETEKVGTEMESSGYVCITRFDETKGKIAAGRPWMWGTLMSGVAFLLCAVYMIRQTKKQRLRENRDRVLMFRDLYWDKKRIKRLFLIDHSILAVATGIVAFITMTIINGITNVNLS